MEERKLPSQVENIFMLFDGWLSKKTTRRLAERQKSCHGSMKGAYHGISKKIVRKSQRWFNGRGADEKMEELEDRFARLTIDDGRGMTEHRRDGPQCFQLPVGFIWRWRFITPLPKVTEEQEAAYLSAIGGRPVHYRYGLYTSQWNMPIPPHPVFGIQHSQWNMQTLPLPIYGVHYTHFGAASATTSSLLGTPTSSERQRILSTPPARDHCMTAPDAPTRLTAKKPIKKWSKSQDNCSHYTDRWWVRINAINDCPNCDVEWEFLYECPECGFQCCPKCKDTFQPPRLEKGYQSARNGVSLKTSGRRYGGRSGWR